MSIEISSNFFSSLPLLWKELVFLSDPALLRLSVLIPSLLESDISRCWLRESCVRLENFDTPVESQSLYVLVIQPFRSCHVVTNIMVQRMNVRNIC